MLRRRMAHQSMAMIGYLCFISSLALSAADNDGVPWYAKEKKLIDSLMKEYNPIALPRYNGSTAVNVKFGLSLQAISELDEDKHTLATIAWGHMEWVDHRLSWDETEHGGIQSIRLPPSKVWIPDITPYNSAGGAFSPPEHASVVVYSRGFLSYLPVWNLKTSCSVNRRHFPYDTQTCTMKFGSWTYNGFMMNLTSMRETALTTTFMEHSAWDLKNASMKRNSKVYECCPEPYLDIEAILELQRRSTSYVYLYVIPPVILAMLTPFIFLLPSAGPHRLIHGAIVIISMTVLLGAYRNFTTSSLLAVFHIGVFFISILTMVFASLVSWIAGKARSGSPPHKLLSTCIGRLLAKLVCICDDGNDGDDDDEHGEVMIDSESLEVTEKPSSRSTHAGEWLRIARVLDRFFFAVFLFTLILMAILLHNKL